MHTSFKLCCVQYFDIIFFSFFLHSSFISVMCIYIYCVRNTLLTVKLVNFRHADFGAQAKITFSSAAQHNNALNDQFCKDHFYVIKMCSVETREHKMRKKKKQSCHSVRRTCQWGIFKANLLKFYQ